MAKSTGMALGRRLIIFYNDFIDVDNDLSALLLLRFFARKSSTRILWILEPRMVSLGLSMTADEKERCKELIEKHFPRPGTPPLKILLGGLLKREDLDGIKGLSDCDYELLRKAIKPGYGSKKDAKKHAELSAWDLAALLDEWSGAPVEVLMDFQSLDEITNPVNLNAHHHEELDARSEDEIKSYNDAMELMNHEERVNSLREWYLKCIGRAKKLPKNKETSVKSLDFESLCSQIKDAASVKFFGGSSLGILSRLLSRKSVASKVECYIQAGSCDLSENLFPNQFNIQLNLKASRHVLKDLSNFKKFTAVPTHSAKSIKYAASDLKQAGGSLIERRILGFSCREDPLKIAKGLITLDKNYPDKIVIMPDLTAFICALGLKHIRAETSFVRLNDTGDVLLFEPINPAMDTDSTKIPIFDLKADRILGPQEVIDILTARSRSQKLWLYLANQWCRLLKWA